MNYPLAPGSASRVCSLTVPDQEIRLSAFIRYSLQKTRTNQVSTDIALQLLNRAWEAQKLLWELQAARIQTEI